MHYIPDIFNDFFFPLQILIYYLTGVSSAGFWNVAVVHSVSTHHASQLILQKGHLWIISVIKAHDAGRGKSLQVQH